MDTYTEALKWVSQGIAVIPCHPWTIANPNLAKVPCCKWTKYQTQLPTIDNLKAWFRPMFNAKRNLAIVTGWIGLTVLDFDSFDYYFTWRNLYPDVETYQVITGRGVHVYLFVDDKSKPPADMGCLGQIKSIGGYVMAPPSSYPSGSAYQVLTDKPILRIGSLKEVLPESFLDAPKPAPVAPPILSKQSSPAQNKVGFADPWSSANNAVINDPLSTRQVIDQIKASIPP